MNKNMSLLDIMYKLNTWYEALEVLPETDKGYIKIAKRKIEYWERKKEEAIKNGAKEPVRNNKMAGYMNTIDDD